MNLRECESGHIYDAEKYDSCPYCADKDAQSGGKGAGNSPSYPFRSDPDWRYATVYAGPPLPDSETKRKKLARCAKGHFYDAARYHSCPYCQENAGRDRSSPVRRALRLLTGVLALLGAGLLLYLLFGLLA